MSDAGEPLMPMVDDREHLYGRRRHPARLPRPGDAATGPRRARRQELAARLEAYQAYPPEHRMAKFSGEPKYEPEARAEIAISYLLHEWAAAHGRPVEALSREELFAQASGVTDFGTGPGLVSHQTRAAWAGAVSKPGFVKFAWQPAHDDWLFGLSGATPMFLPATAAKVQRPYRARVRVRCADGFDASATLLLPSTAASPGSRRCPTGAVVYATSGTAAGRATSTCTT